MQNDFAVSLFLVRFETYCIVDTTFVKQKTLLLFWEIDFIAFHQSKSSFAVARNNRANSFVVARNNRVNDIDQTGFIFTVFHEFVKVT